MVADDLFQCLRGLEVLRMRHAMGDDGGFQRPHRPVLVKRILYFGRDLERHLQSSFTRRFSADDVCVRFFKLILRLTLSAALTARPAAAWPSKAAGSGFMPPTRPAT